MLGRVRSGHIGRGEEERGIGTGGMWGIKVEEWIERVCKKIGTVEEKERRGIQWRKEEWLGREERGVRREEEPFWERTRWRRRQGERK